MKLKNIGLKAPENVFYGKKHLLELLQSVNTLKQDNLSFSTVEKFLNNAYSECKTKEDRQLFYSIIFSFGDIQNREHNLFKGAKKDKGGEALRKAFIFCLKWILENNPKQFVKFIQIIPEYTNFENLFYFQVRTKGKKVIESISIVNDNNKDFLITEVTKYLAGLISSPKTPAETHELIAKFLNKPRFSKRGKAGSKYQMQSWTYKKELFEKEIAQKLSGLLGWEIQTHPYVRFIGLEKYKSSHNQLQSEVLFSTKRILEFDKNEFLNFLDKLPSASRFRVQRMILDKNGNPIEKWGKLGAWYQEWLSLKSKAAEEVRLLEFKLKNEKLSIDEEKLLMTKRKEAKVTTGATDFLNLISDFYKNGKSSKELELVADSLLNKINIEVPILPIVDISGSMGSVRSKINGVDLSSRDLASLFTTLFLAKNPLTDTSKGDVLIRFDSDCDILYTGSKNESRGENRFMSNKSKKVKNLYNSKKTFFENFKEIDKFILSKGSTNISAISDGLNKWVNENVSEKQSRIEMVQSYPVWLILSDGDLNSSYSPKDSIIKFKHQMKQYFGWDGVLVIWDLKLSNEIKAPKFEDVENIMYFPSLNVQTLNQVFTKIHDLDIIDVYTTLKSLYLSNRYDDVKERII